MANTIDIIYRFLADTKQFQQELNQIKQSGEKVASDVKAPDYKQMEQHLRGVNREITRLRDTGQISVEKATKLKEQYAAARKEAAALARELEKVRKAQGEKASGVPLQQKQQMKQAARAKIYEYEGEYIPGQMEDFEEAMARTFQKTEKGWKDLRTNTMTTQGAVQKFGMEFQMGMHRGGAALDQVNVKTKQTRASVEELGRALMAKGFSFYGIRLLGASVVQLGQTMTILGGVATGGIFKAANDYIKNAPEANETTRQWAEQMRRVETAQARIGKVMASETLPFLEKGADLLGKLADFLEKNPEAAGNVLKAGLVLTGLGAMVMAVGKGINLVSDTAFIAASIQMARSGRDNIIASGVMMRASQNNVKAAAVSATTSTKQGVGGLAGLLTGLKSGTGFLGALGTATVLLSSFSAGLIAADKWFDAMQKRDVQMKDYFTILKQAIAIDAKSLGDFFGKNADYSLRPGQQAGNENLGFEWFKKVSQALGLIPKPAKDAVDSLSELSDVLKNSLKRDEVLAAYEEYKADDLELIRKHHDDRLKVLRDAESATRKANQNLAQGIADAYRNQARDLSKAARDYAEKEEDAAQDYAEKRADILRDAGEEALKIEQDLQEKLRKLRMDYEDREKELLAQRDAVGLIKNRQKYIRDAQEAEREANREIAQRRQQVAQKLAELQREYEQERAQRLEDYKQRIAEIQEATKIQVEELRRRHAEELREIQIDRNNKLRELDISLVEERKRRYNAFIAQVRDLDAALLGESKLRKKYQDAMLKELDAFLARYRSGMGSLLTSVPSKQVGGYVNGGLYRLHDNEFVLNPGTTASLERLLGGRLTQSMVLQAAGTSSRTNVTWNDSRRFDSSLRPSDRRQIYEDTIGILGSVVKR